MSLQISPSIVSHPAATFENITYVNFDGTSSFAVSEVVLRLRPTIRKEIDSDVKTNAIPNHSLAGKNKNITQRNDTLIQSIEPSLKDKLMKKKQISEPESDDTIQIKVSSVAVVVLKFSVKSEYFNKLLKWQFSLIY